MSYIQTSVTPFDTGISDISLSVKGFNALRLIDGLLLNEHDKNIYETFEPTIASLSMTVNDRIRKLEKYLLTQEQVTAGLEHEFIDGLYKRTMRVPAGTVLTGAIHRVKHMDVMTEGSMLVITEDGTKQIDAPFTMTTQEGVKKCGIALTDVTWCTFHAAPYDTIEEMEAHIHSKNDEDIFIEGEVDDYLTLLSELNITDEQVKAQSFVTHDMIDMNKEYDHITKRESPINGYGLFSSKDININEVICPARLNGNRTIAGRYANHSKTPNAKPILVGDDVYYKATESIDAGSELTINYRDSIKINPDVLKGIEK